MADLMAPPAPDQLTDRSALLAGPVLRGLDTGVAEQLLTATVRHRRAAGSVVFAEGHAGTSLFLIESGLVKLVRVDPRGRARVSRLMGPGDPVWDLAPSGGRRGCTAVAVSECRLREVEHGQLEAWQEARPAVSVGLLGHAAALLREINDVATGLRTSDAATRTARTVLRLAERFGRPAGPEASELEVVHGLTQVELAELAGVTRETLNKSLAGLSRDGVLRVARRRFVVCDAAGLRDRT